MIHSGADAAATPKSTGASPRAATPALRGSVPPWQLASETSAEAATPSTVPSTVPPTTAPPTTTTSPPTTQPATEVAQRSVPATPVTAPPTTTTAPSVSGSLHYGQVTYYDHPAGTCASPFLSFGTLVRVTNPTTGASVTCLVNDREADTARSIDLATATFAELAPLSQGVINAELTW